MARSVFCEILVTGPGRSRLGAEKQPGGFDIYLFVFKCGAAAVGLHRRAGWQRRVGAAVRGVTGGGECCGVWAGALASGLPRLCPALRTRPGRAVSVLCVCSQSPGVHLLVRRSLILRVTKSAKVKVYIQRRTDLASSPPPGGKTLLSSSRGAAGV